MAIAKTLTMVQIHLLALKVVRSLLPQPKSDLLIFDQYELDDFENCYEIKKLTPNSLKSKTSWRKIDI